MTDADLDRLAEHYLDEQIRGAQDRLSALRKAKRAMNKGLPIVWHIEIRSAWVNLGRHHEDEKHIANNYHSVSLREAIRSAATDFCVLNRRSYPGRRWQGAREMNTSTNWDVQGDWYVSLVIAPGVHMSIPREMYEKHVKELREDTNEVYGPEAESARKIKLPTIP